MESLTAELLQGVQLAKLLQLTHKDPSSSADDRLLILDSILSTYGNALSMLNHCSTQSPHLQPRARSASDEVKVAYSIDDDAPVDGYSWRKYGQKNIHRSTFPREYYRCAHRKSNGCRALKKIQRSDEDPTKIEITYSGHHTCRDDEQNACHVHKSREGVGAPIAWNFTCEEDAEKEGVFKEIPATILSPSTAESGIMPWYYYDDNDHVGVAEFSPDVYSGYTSSSGLNTIDGIDNQFFVGDALQGNYK